MEVYWERMKGFTPSASFLAQPAHAASRLLPRWGTGRLWSVVLVVVVDNDAKAGNQALLGSVPADGEKGKKER